MQLLRVRVSIFLSAIIYSRRHSGVPCDHNGNSLPRGAPPPPLLERAADDWSPFRDRAAFELADLLYADEQMSAGNINALLEIWAASVSKHNDTPPFSNAADLYSTIDRTTLGQSVFET